MELGIEFLDRARHFNVINGTSTRWHVFPISKVVGWVAGRIQNINGSGGRDISRTIGARVRRSTKITP